MLEQINGEAFDAKVRQSSKPVVVDFFGKQCQPCKKLLPILEDVEKTYGDRITFVKVDVEEAEDVASELGIYSVPTVVFFKDGHPADKVTGLTSKATLTSRLDDLLA